MTRITIANPSTIDSAEHLVNRAMLCSVDCVWGSWGWADWVEPLAETLARMGVGSLTLIDDDVLELSNVRRVFGVTRDDAEQRRPKAEAVAAGLERLGIGTTLRAVYGDVREPAIQAQLLDCDVLFSATDTHSSRAAMTELAVRGCYPLIDLGVRLGMRRGGELDSLLFERRIQLPRGPCLWCWRRLDAHRIRIEFMSSFERQALLAEGYVTGLPGEPEPSVAALTVTAAGAGAAALLGLLAGGLDQSRLGSSFELLRSEAFPLGAPRARTPSAYAPGGGRDAPYHPALAIGRLRHHGEPRARVTTKFYRAAKVHHQVLRSDPVTFNYRPTPPSGPAPKPQPNTERPERAHRTKKD